MWIEIKKGDLEGYQKIDDIINFTYIWVHEYTEEINLESILRTTNTERFFIKKGASVWVYEDNEVYIVLKGKEYPLDSSIFQLYDVNMSPIDYRVLKPCLSNVDYISVDIPIILEKVHLLIEQMVCDITKGTTYKKVIYPLTYAINQFKDSIIEYAEANGCKCSLIMDNYLIFEVN